MKTRFFWITVLLLIAMIGCEKVQQDKLPEEIKKLTERNMRLQSLRNSGITHFRIPANSYLKSSMLKSGKVDGGDSTNVVNDSICEYWDWESCAEISEYEDENGFFVTVMDYGEQGCEEWGSLIKGKITIKWKMDNNSSYFEEIYEDYEAYGMTMNGSFNCSSEGEWPFYNSTGTEDDFEIISTCQENLIISYEDGETFTYVSSFTDKYTNDSYIMLEGEFEYSSSTGEKFTYRIIEPVVSDFQCQNSYMPVSGIELWEDGDNSYKIDYGDGQCDNIVTITEDGKTYVVNWDEEFFDDAQAADSTAVSF